MSKYEIKSHKKVFDGFIVNVYHDEVVLEDDILVLKEVVEAKGAAAVLPIDNQGNILFVRQYRHPAKQEVLEIPAGTLEKDEDPKDCAIRELEEETGFKCNKIKFIAKVYQSVGFCTEAIHIYLATELVEGVQNLDENEFITIEKYNLEEAISMINKGEIIDSKTMLGILWYANNKLSN